MPTVSWGETFVVTTTADSGPGSLRQAILDANASPGSDEIEFHIESENLTLTPLSGLPIITEPVVLDGFTQPGTAGIPIIELSGQLAPSGTSGFRIETTGVTLRGFVINRWKTDGIRIEGGGQNVIEGCYVGLGLDGVSLLANSQNGVHIIRSSGNRVGGLDNHARNVISGNNAIGIRIVDETSVDNVIVNNLIGLNATGTAPFRLNSHGISVESAVGTVIGGTEAFSGNIISGNSIRGISISLDASKTRIQGNIIGLNDAADARFPNGQGGIYITAGADTLIGGSEPSARNMIAGNTGSGIELSGVNTTLTSIYGNFIGTNPDLALDLGNTGAGVHITSNSSNNRIGGVDIGQSNTIAHNGGNGVWVQTGTENTIRGNSIFLNAGLGIDLGLGGVSQNDPTDSDTGANRLRNFPVLHEAVLEDEVTRVSGSLQSLNHQTFTIDFYANQEPDPTHHGEGEVWLGSIDIATDGSGFTRFTATLPATDHRFISATTTDASGNTSEFSFTRRAVTTQASMDLVVTNTDDSGPGSLRQAILDANDRLNEGDRITFLIPGDGPHVIAPTTALPPLQAPVTVDGYTQPGATPNTDPSGFNATLSIVLDGNDAPNNTDGIRIESSRVTLRGLVIQRFRRDGIHILAASSGNRITGNVIGLLLDASRPGGNQNTIVIANSPDNRIGGSSPDDRNVLSGSLSHGIHITGNSARNNHILGNFIGTDLSGRSRSTNRLDGIHIAGSPNNQIGGSNPGEGNVIGGNQSEGIEIQNTQDIVIQGNTIGGALDGTPIPNNSHGILIHNSFNVLIGGTAPGTGNVIAFNNNRGVAITHNNSQGNSILGNSIHSNANLGIDLANNGQTANDPLDADVGPNDFQNFPVLEHALTQEGATRIQGSLHSRPDSQFRLEFFSSRSPDPTGFGEGEQFLGATSVETDEDGDATFDVTLPTQALGRHITATATAGDEATSEFSAAVRAQSTLPASTYVVTHTGPSGPGSLAQALLDADQTMTGPPHHITFDIPGEGPHVFDIATSLPVPQSESVFIDGFSQPGASPNTLEQGNDAVPQIVLDGSNGNFGSNGLRLITDGNVIRGLIVANFKGNGIEITGHNNRVEGCRIGMDYDGIIAPNSSNGVLLTGGASGNRVGGRPPDTRNVVSGNGNSNIRITNNAGSNHVEGNFIGTSPDGSQPLERPPGLFANTMGVSIESSADNWIGASQPGAGNVISGHTGLGIDIRNSASSGNRVQGNFIGTDPTGKQPVPNTDMGIWIANSPNNSIGGTEPGEGNRIAFNGNHGVSVSGFSTHHGNAIRGNSITGNLRLGINLGFDGVLPNDPLDANTQEANRGQNYPGLASAWADTDSITVTGLLHSRPLTTFFIDLFANKACHTSGHGEGDQFLGWIEVETDEEGNAPFEATLPVLVAGRQITATATDPDGNTSEFSACLSAQTDFPPETFVVTHTGNDGPGSLRDALNRNNLSAAGSANRIEFDIPGDGPHVFAIQSPLPAILNPVIIDGYTQPGSSPNTLTGADTPGARTRSNPATKAGSIFDPFSGSDAQIGIEIQFAGGGGTRAIELAGDNSAIRGLSFTSWNTPVHFTGNHNVVEGCFIGVKPDGSLPTQRGGGIFVASGSGNRIGGSLLAERNVVSGIQGSGIMIQANAQNVVVQGNLIGTNPLGDQPLSNSGDGIFVAGTGHQIGGPTPAHGNLISGNLNGIRLSSADDVVIANNLIGTNAEGLDRLPNASGGIFLDNSANVVIRNNLVSGNNGNGIESNSNSTPGNRIVGNLIGIGSDLQTSVPNGLHGVRLTGPGTLVGGPNPGDGNVIAHNPGAGISLAGSSATGNLILGNSVFDNADRGISLSAGGIPPNDPGDADTGPNQLQNFPIITSAIIHPNRVEVAGSLESMPDTTFLIGVYSNQVPDRSGHGQGQQFLGTTTVTTDAQGMGLFSASLDISTHFLYISATASDPNNNTSEYSLSFKADNTLPPRTFLVTTTEDSGEGSLRQVIFLSNQFPVGTGLAHQVTFDIPGISEEHRILLSSPLPIPANALNFDGFSQSGASPNTDPDGDNAVRTITVDGSNLPFGSPVLSLNQPGSIVSGLTITDGSNGGIRLGSPGGVTLLGNHIENNDGDGVLIENSGNNQIGGIEPAQRNVIVNNSGAGIRVLEPLSHNNRIHNNWIGIDPFGVPAPNTVGIRVQGGTSLLVGGIDPGEANSIAFNQGPGVHVSGGSGATIRGNSIFENTGLGIALGTQGVTPNDFGDTDTGPNDLQNYPLIEVAQALLEGGRVTGTFNSSPNLFFWVDFYLNPNCHPSGHGPGEVWVGSTEVMTDGEGNAVFDVATQRQLHQGTLSATATNPNGSTSELSPCQDITSGIPPIVIEVTTDADSGFGSLRAAIETANNRFSFGPNPIHFNIPGTGIRTIQPLTPLPDITRPVMIDGLTQTGSRVDNSGETLNHFLPIRIDGSLAGSGSDGFRIFDSGVILRGLNINGFDEAAVAVFGDANGFSLQDSIIGVAPGATADDPFLPAGNRYGAYFHGGHNGSSILPVHQIVNSTINNSLEDGVVVDGTQADILGSFIGLGPDGTGGHGNAEHGVNLMNGQVSILDTILSGNGGFGFYTNPGPGFTGVTRAEIQDSIFGTDILGNPVSNAAGGLFAGGQFNGWLLAQDSIFAGNGGPGAFLGRNANNARFFGNTFGTPPGSPFPAPNQGPGILVDGATGVNIGGFAILERNHFGHLEGENVMIVDGFDLPLWNNFFSVVRPPRTESTYAPPIPHVNANFDPNGVFLNVTGSQPPGSPLPPTVHTFIPSMEFPGYMEPSVSQEATLNPDGSWSADVTLQPGQSSVWVMALDGFGNPSQVITRVNPSEESADFEALIRELSSLINVGTQLPVQIDVTNLGPSSADGLFTLQTSPGLRILTGPEGFQLTDTENGGQQASVSIPILLSNSTIPFEFIILPEQAGVATLRAEASPFILDPNLANNLGARSFTVTSSGPSHVNSIQLRDGRLVITWEGRVLKKSLTLKGEYSDIPNPPKPYVIDLNDFFGGPDQFFRSE